MRKILGLVMVLGFASCDNSGTVKPDLDSVGNEVDTFVNRINNSEVMDSIRSKGGVILDSVKSKGGKLVNKAEEEFNDLKTKDSAN